MKVRVEVEMLVVGVALFLALGVSDGLVISKCELGRDLNSSLPAKLLEKVPNLVAKIVCHVDLSAHFNTSTINHIPGPEIPKPVHGGKGARRGRSAESSSEDSSEEDTEIPQSSFNSTTGSPFIQSQESHEESSEEDTDSSNGARRRRRFASRSSPEGSSEEHGLKPQPNFNSSTVNPLSRPNGNNSFSGEGRRGRKVRALRSKEKNIWTLYGLFQLPDEIACTSVLEPSLDVCNMTCNSLVDQNIKDDITCVKTILTKMLLEPNTEGPDKPLYTKLEEEFFPKECKNVKDSQYFSTC